MSNHNEIYILDIMCTQKETRTSSKVIRLFMYYIYLYPGINFKLT